MNKRMQQKEQTRTALKQQLETQCKTFSNVEKDAQALLLKALHAGRKVTVRFCYTDYHHQVIEAHNMACLAVSSACKLRT